MRMSSQRLLVVFLVINLFFFVASLKIISFRDANLYRDSNANELIAVKSNSSIPNINIDLPRTDAKILIFGDTALLEPLGSMVVNDPTYNPFSNLMHVFAEYDYVVGDHESTIDGVSVGSPNPGKPYTFSIPKESVKVYKEAGIDAFSYANNHTRDYGPQSVLHTIKLLNQGGIEVFGAGANTSEAFKPLIKEINGNKIAFLAYNCAEYAYNIASADTPGTAYYNEWLVRDSIAKAKKESDVVIVMPHCGTENITTPDEMQIQWAQIFTSAGADIVIGGHPHVRQAPAVVNGKPVIYSVGNFMFPGQSINEEKRTGWMVEVIVDNKQYQSYRLIETRMDDIGVPTLK
jgi:poly-gamma-glutamate capsule biosynthesis protein CapA/YwtB (metallophosphatase superfamily)